MDYLFSIYQKGLRNLKFDPFVVINQHHARVFQSIFITQKEEVSDTKKNEATIILQSSNSIRRWDVLRDVGQVVQDKFKYL